MAVIIIPTQHMLFHSHIHTYIVLKFASSLTPPPPSLCLSVSHPSSFPLSLSLLLPPSLSVSHSPVHPHSSSHCTQDSSVPTACRPPGLTPHGHGGRGRRCGLGRGHRPRDGAGQHTRREEWSLSEDSAATEYTETAEEEPTTHRGVLPGPDSRLLECILLYMYMYIHIHVIHNVRLHVHVHM